MSTPERDPMVAYANLMAEVASVVRPDQFTATTTRVRRWLSTEPNPAWADSMVTAVLEQGYRLLAGVHPQQEPVYASMALHSVSDNALRTLRAHREILGETEG